jgi:O-antigen/teichoic acid export membrane protein
LLGTTLGGGMGALRLARVSKLLGGLTLDRFRWASLRLHAARHAYTATASSFSGLMNVVANQAPLLLMTAFFGTAQSGLLMLAIRLISAADVLIGIAVGQVFLGEAAARFRESPQALRVLFRNTVLGLAIPSAVVSAAIWVLAPLVVPRLFGSAWADTGLYARYLALRFLASVVCSPVSTVAFILGKQGQQVVWEISRMAAILIGFWWCGAAQLGPRTAVLVYSLVSFAAYAAWLLVLGHHVANARA